MLAIPLLPFGRRARRSRGFGRVLLGGPDCGRSRRGRGRRFSRRTLQRVPGNQDACVRSAWLSEGQPASFEAAGHAGEREAAITGELERGEIGLPGAVIAWRGFGGRGHGTARVASSCRRVAGRRAASTSNGYPLAPPDELTWTRSPEPACPHAPKQKRTAGMTPPSAMSMFAELHCSRRAAASEFAEPFPQPDDVRLFQLEFGRDRCVRETPPG